MNDETTMLETSKVPGTSVYNNAQEEIGAVDDLIVDTASGKVRYAILSFGGFLGIGKSQYVIPWTALKWDPELNGYITGVTEDQLKMSPGPRPTFAPQSGIRATSPHGLRSTGLLGNGAR